MAAGSFRWRIVASGILAENRLFNSIYLSKYKVVWMLTYIVGIIAKNWISSNRKFPETDSNKFVKFGDFAEVANFSQAPPTGTLLKSQMNQLNHKIDHRDLVHSKAESTSFPLI